MSAVLEPCVEILPMHSGDLDEVLAVEGRVCPFPWSRNNFIDSIASGYQCRVCRVDGELVGYFVLMLAMEDAHLLSLGVGEKRQRMGFGARLLRMAMRVAREGGAKTMLLEVRPSNEKALAMYRHFGFRQVGVRRGYYPAEAGREDALVLTHTLAETSA